jgi:PhoD related phosphatase
MYTQRVKANVRLFHLRLSIHHLLKLLVIYCNFPLNITNTRHRRNKIHHLDHETDEDMVAIFQEDVDGKPLHNKHLLPRRNWCGMQVVENGDSLFDLDIVLNVEVNCKNPEGKTKGYGMRVPILTV